MCDHNASVRFLIKLSDLSALSHDTKNTNENDGRSINHLTTQSPVSCKATPCPHIFDLLQRIGRVSEDKAPYTSYSVFIDDCRNGVERYHLSLYVSFIFICSVSLTIRKLEQELLDSSHYVCILTTISGDPEHTGLVGPHPNRKVIFMDNAIPIPFVDDPERPELTYQIGFALSPAVKKEIDDFEPSIIHMTVPDVTSLHIIQYARAKEIPLMGTYHSNIPEYMEHYPGLSWLKHILGGFFRHQYNYLQALYVPTPYIQRHLIETYAMDRVTTLKVWGRGVDIDKFNPAYRSMEYRRSFGIPDDAAVVLWVGRLVPEKRPDIFVNVIRRLHAKGLNYHALVVGAGPCEKDIKSLPNTTFAGWLSKDELSTAYASSDIFLFPSAVETFGNVTLEAAASGLPVVVESACSGHLVHDSENGFTAAAGDEETFYEATLALVEDRHMREEFGANSREMALSLEKSTVVRQMIDNYSRVTNEFYTEYSGHHEQRDSAYTQPESFLLGKYPRPLILVFVEYLFVFIFQLFWNLSVVWQCLLTRLCCKKRKVMSNAKNSIAEKTIDLKPSHAATPSITPNRLLREMQAAIDSTSTSNLSVVELHDLEIGHISKEPLLGSDDNTTTTGNSSQDSSSSSQSFGDCRLSHALAKLFVKTVQFQCRMESHARQVLTCSSPHIKFLGAAKRKNSSMAGVSMNDVLERPELTRGRSEASSDDMLVPMNEDISPTSCGLQEGRIMRRTQSSLLDIY